MSSSNLRRSSLVQQLATTFQQAEANMKFAGLPRGTLRGTVCDVNDPENRGRICVIFDDMNPDIPQVSGAGEWSKERVGEEPDRSHWLDVSPAFRGKQPKGLVGKRVNIVPSNGQYTMACAQDVVCDPQLLAEGKQNKLKMPNNSSMTRLPVYEPDEIPEPSEDNHGCVIIENNGPMSGDWMCVCVKRDGKYYWVRLADLAHGHAGGNDGTQQVDSMGNRQNPVMMGAVSDNVFVTTHQQMVVNSGYTTKPAGNPKGETAHWYPAPKSGDVYKPGSNFPLLNPLPDVALKAVRDAASFPGIASTIQGFIPSFNPKIPVVLATDAVEALQKAQSIAEQVASTVNTAQAIATNPAAASVAATKFVSDQALSVSAGSNPLGIPPGTEVALASIPDPAGVLPTSLPIPSAKSLPSQIISAFKNVIGFG